MTISTDHKFSLTAPHDEHGYIGFGRARILYCECTVVAQVEVGRDAEAELALCLRSLVEIGLIDVEKLRAALVLAEPVAQEKVAEAARGHR
jgi:hypothetical protein